MLLELGITMNSEKPLNDIPNKLETDGGVIKETDAAGREKFWEDIGRP